MAKWVALTARKLKPGTYGDWRQAWESGETPEGVKAYICRNVKDPDEIVAFGILETTAEELESIQPSRETEEARVAAMAPYVESTSTDGIYEVIEEVTF
jgi:hypothetical protein